MFFSAWNHQGLHFKNRLVHAGMTRVRADPATGLPSDLMKQYYVQRSGSAGLFVTEFMPVNKYANPWPGSGALWTQANALKWKEIVDAVHTKGTVFFAQLGHGGRLVHPVLGHGKQPISASPVACPGEISTPSGKQPHVVPQEATHEQIKEVVNDFVVSAQHAKAAGFDGIEIGAATGLLLDTFLQTGTNQRKDRYGELIENRSRFLWEVIHGVSSVYPYNRIGVKLSPVNSSFQMRTDDPKGDLAYVLKEAEKLNLLYVNLVEPDTQAGADKIAVVAEEARKTYGGFLITNGYRTPEQRIEAVEKGQATMAAFAKLFAANPDLADRLKNKWPLNNFNLAGAYGQTGEGYTNYPDYKQPEMGDQ